MSDIRCFGGWIRQDGKYFEFDHGPTVPTEVLELIRALDVRGLQFQRNGDSLRVFRDDGETLEYLDGERAQIAQWKFHILAVIEYGKPEPVPAPEPVKTDRRKKTRPAAETPQQELPQ